MGIRQTFRSKLLRDTASYSIINILDKAIPFLIMPIISRVLTKEDMGYYSLYQVKKSYGHPHINKILGKDDQLKNLKRNFSLFKIKFLLVNNKII